MDDEMSRWYENMTYAEAKSILQENLYSLKTSFIAAGYYLKYIRDNELFREDGYKNIWEFAEDNYGIRKSTASRWMAMNDKFSQGGNSPILAEEFREFEKSQLQEMLYLDDKQIETVTPAMTVRQIREVRKPELLSAYGTKKRVYPEDSLLKTDGCEGGHDCFSCAQQCGARGENRYCREATMGNPFPCETMNSIPFLREAFGDKCMFVNSELSRKSLGSGEADPCCKDCVNPCTRECERAFWFRSEKNRDKVEDVATSQHDAEEQLPGQMSVEDFPEFLPDQYEAEAAGTEVVETDLPEEEKYEELSDETDMDLLYDLLDKEKYTLQLMLESFTEDDVRVRKQKLTVGAFAGMIADLGLCDIPETIQPELPNFKNNDQRKEWLHDYKAWGLWYEDENIGARYYKYDFNNGARLIAETYIHPGDKYMPEHESRFLHLVGGPEPPRDKSGRVPKWQRHERYNRFPSNETELVEFLKYIQKEGK